MLGPHVNPLILRVERDARDRPRRLDAEEVPIQLGVLHLSTLARSRAARAWRGEPLDAALALVDEDLAELLEQVGRLHGEARDLVDDVPSTVRQTVDLEHGMVARPSAAR